MSEKSPDFTPAPSVLPEGMYGPDNFAVRGKDAQPTTEHGFRQIELVSLPAGLQERFKDRPEDSVYLADDVGLKIYDAEAFGNIQTAEDERRAAERAPIYADLQAEVDARIESESRVQAETVEQLVDRHDSPEHAISEAKSVFDDRLNQIVNGYALAVDSQKGSVRGQAGELFTSQKRAERAAEEAYTMLRGAVGQPEAAFRAITGALDQLNGLQATLAGAEKTTSVVSGAANQLLARATEHREELLRLGAEFTAVVSQIGEKNNSDVSTVDAVIGQAREATSGQVTISTWLENSASDLITVLGSSENPTDQVRQKVRIVTAQLEAMSYQARQGRLNNSEYTAAVQLVRGIVDGLEEGTGQARRIASAAGEL